MHQPLGFVDSWSPSYVCYLRKSLYGLKEAPYAWYTRFASFVTSHGFKSSICDSSLFIYQNGRHCAYLLLYVDDIILTASDPAVLYRLITSLSKEFSMTDLGPLHHYLDITPTRDEHGLFCHKRLILVISFNKLLWPLVNHALHKLIRPLNLVLLMVNLLPMALSTTLFSAPSGIWLLHDRTLHMLFNKFAFSCMPHVCHIFSLRRRSFVIYKVRLTMVYR